MTNNDDRILAQYKFASEQLSQYETKPDLFRQTMRNKFPEDSAWADRGQVHDWLTYGLLTDLCHDVACYSYRIDHDIPKFFDCESKVPEYILKRYNDAKETSEETLRVAFTPSAYVKMFHGLAGRNFEGARRLAQLLIDTEVFEKSCFGQTDADYYGGSLMYLLTGYPIMWDRYERLKKRKKGDGKAFAKIFEGLLNKDQAIAQEGIADLVKALKRQSEWVDDHIGYLNTWALGMANLCRLHGVYVGAVEPQVPADLLIPQEEVDAVLRQWPELGRLPPKE